MGYDKKKYFYPAAQWRPLFSHSAPGELSQRNLIVLHITDGPTAAGAMETFRASKPPHRVSAHFVIDRDGTVYQLLTLNDTAWHASAVNAHSIGIEHAARAARSDQHGNPIHSQLPATPAQYEASAKLVAWLAKQMNIPVDRAHVRTHNEVSPGDGHTLCCTGALDPDQVVALAQEVTVV